MIKIQSTISILLTAALVILSACVANPVNEANTFEQKAYALYGTYVIFQGKAAEIAKDTTVSESIRQALREADRVSYPVAESLVDAAVEVGSIRDVLDQCPAQPEPDPQCVPTNQQRLANATLNLSSIYFKAAPVLLNMVAAVKGAKP